MVENHTRERLTGAAILVAVIVLLVPELLSGPRRAAPQAIAVIDEAPVRTYTMSLGDAQQSTAAATAEGARSDWPPASTPARVADGTARATPVAPAAAPAPAAPAPVSARSAESRSVESRSAEAVVKSASSKSESPPSGSVASAHAATEHAAARKIPARDEGAAHEWAVQVGSFGSRENADRLAHSLKLKGYGASVSESSSRGRKWYRVRVGPQRDRAAADAIAARLRATGLRGAVAQPR